MLGAMIGKRRDEPLEDEVDTEFLDTKFLASGSCADAGRVVYWESNADNRSGAHAPRIKR